MAEKALELGIRARGQQWCGPPDLPAADTMAWVHAQVPATGPWARLNAAANARLNGAPQPPPFKAAPPGKLRQLRQANLVESSSPPASSHGHEPRSSGLGPCQQCEVNRCLWV